MDGESLKLLCVSLLKEIQKLFMSVSKIKIFLDLDKTIWDTFDKYGNQAMGKTISWPTNS